MNQNGNDLITSEECDRRYLDLRNQAHELITRMGNRLDWVQEQFAVRDEIILDLVEQLQRAGLFNRNEFIARMRQRIFQPAPTDWDTFLNINPSGNQETRGPHVGGIKKNKKKKRKTKNKKKRKNKKSRRRRK